KRRIRPSSNGQSVRQQGCPRARLHRLNSSPPGPCLPLEKAAETRTPALVGSFDGKPRPSGPDGNPMRVTTDERSPYRQTEPSHATKGSPTGGNTYVDRVPVVAQRPEERPGHGQGGQAPALQTNRGIRMENQALARLEALRKHNADRGWVNFDLYRLLYRPELYEVAYERIKSKPGNMTAGSDGNTLDGFSFRVITDLIERLRDESFQFQPARRIFIPKANGKQRPLGIPSPLDKVVQEVLRLIIGTNNETHLGAYFRHCSPV